MVPRILPLLTTLLLAASPVFAGPRCGPATCADGLLCCNDTCGICVPPDGACIQPHCGWTPARAGQFAPALPTTWPGAMTVAHMAMTWRHGDAAELPWHQALGAQGRVALDRAAAHAVSLRVIEGVDYGDLLNHDEVAMGWSWSLPLGLPWLRLGPLVEIGVVKRFETRAGLSFTLGRGIVGLSGHALWRGSASAWRATGEMGTRSDGSTYDMYDETNGLGHGLDLGLAFGFDGTAMGQPWRLTLAGRMRRDPTNWHWPLDELEVVFDWADLGPFSVGLEAGLGRRVEGWPAARWPRWLALRLGWLP